MKIEIEDGTFGWAVFCLSVMAIAVVALICNS